MHAYIDDGYTITSTIAATDLHDAHTVTYRPATTADIARYQSALKTAGDDPDKERQCLCEFLASKVTAWNVRAFDGAEVPVNAESMGRLIPAFFWAVFELVFRGASDLKNLPRG